jgi:hypothetical protein
MNRPTPASALASEPKKRRSARPSTNTAARFTIWNERNGER